RIQLEDIGGVTASLGVAAFRTTDSPDSFLRRADDALYRAKDTGRNKVMLEQIKDKAPAL
ncbi:diguanylate cyclase domain-containing protein, partial [Methylophaga sp.]|uniref:diguanylate cyclase domain-containing protein n=1 Tax=Methylophaga sp. TaxID=2024840 RepID=UPI003F696543